MAERDGQLTQVEVRSFITLGGEKLIVATRKHWFSLVVPISIVLLLTSFFSLASFLIFAVFTKFIALFVSSLLVIVVLTTSLITKIVVDWYYHLYIVTTRRILEVSYSPFFSNNIYDVLLDQVRITEIDIRIGNILYEFLNMGDVSISFDRPSHEEKFIFRNIHNPRQIGVFLCDAFETMTHDMSVWFQPRRTSDLLRMTEDVFPDRSQALKS